MKNYLAVAIAVIGLGVASQSMADRGRDHYYRDHGGRHVIINNYGYSRHMKPHYYHKYRHDYRPRHYYRGHPGPYIVERHYHDDDAYKWLGGIYILNEVLHHRH